MRTSSRSPCRRTAWTGGGFTPSDARRVPRFLAGGPALAYGPIVALSTVMGLDLALSQRPWPVVLVGLLDEPAHLLTTLIILGARPWVMLRGRWRWVLIGSVAIDIDHLPMYTFASTFAANGRPPTHSLFTVSALLVLAALVSSQLRAPLIAVSFGICSHLIRDLATGPGVPLYWPLSEASVHVPFVAYAVLLGVCAAQSTRRLFAWQRDETRTASLGRGS